MPILFFVLICWGIKPSRTRWRDDRELVSVESGRSLRGMLAIIVVLHHIAPYTGRGPILNGFMQMSAWPVAFFFFLSGYGLQKQYISKGESYQNGFLKKRLPAVVIPYIVFTLALWVFYATGGKLYSLQNMFSGIKNGDTFVPHAWYLITLFFFYFFFWVMMKTCRQHYLRMICLSAVWYLLYTLVCIKLKFGIWWFCMTHFLLIGMFCAMFERQILSFFRKYPAAMAGVIVIGLSVSAVSTKLSADVQALSMAKFVILYVCRLTGCALALIPLNLLLRIGNPVLDYLGKISMEIYLGHGLVQYFLRGERFYVQNDFLYCVLCVLGAIAVGIVFHAIDNGLLSAWKRASGASKTQGIRV